MVKLQKRFAYRYKGKEEEKVHYKYVITVPEGIVNELGLEEGDDLDQRVVNGRLVIQASDGQRRMRK